MIQLFKAYLPFLYIGILCLIAIIFQGISPVQDLERRTANIAQQLQYQKNKNESFDKIGLYKLTDTEIIERSKNLHIPVSRSPINPLLIQSIITDLASRGAASIVFNWIPPNGFTDKDFSWKSSNQVSLSFRSTENLKFRLNGNQVVESVYLSQGSFLSQTYELWQGRPPKFPLLEDGFALLKFNRSYDDLGLGVVFL